MTKVEILYSIGLFLVILYIFTGIDDFIWDTVTLFKRLRHKNKDLDIKDLNSKPPKLIALIVAAWHEDNVLEDVIENILLSQQYPRSMYHIFLGVYPNDDATVEVAKALNKKYPNVHCIVNFKPGPTSKAQNINYVISRVKNFEKEKGWRFGAISVHDSEDVVHPYEFKVTNYLLDKYPALQFPVFPLIRKPTLWNFFKNITTNTYADEFAENHYITMVSRHRTGAFVPSAGTGFSLSRDTVESLGESVLPENSLTEDYRLSLTLYEMGLQMHYVLERIKRVNSEGKLKWDYIATRSMFPNTFKTAVKQKTRWTLGITMQSYSFKELFKGDMSFVGRYSLYKDQKAKIGNLLSAVGYPVLIYFILSLFFNLTPIYPIYSLSWYLSLIVTIMMIERQFFRATALYNVYGVRSVFFGCLFPPLLPIRIVWGNIINLVSTFKAYIQFLSHDTKKSKTSNATEKPATEKLSTVKDVHKENENLIKIENQKVQTEMDIQGSNNIAKQESKIPEEKKFAWTKTDHSFLEKDVLVRFHRKLGDILIEKGYLTAIQIKDFLKDKSTEQPLGKYLLNNNYITEQQLIEALSAIKHTQYLQEDSLECYALQQFASEFNKEFLQKYSILPLLKTDSDYVFAYSECTPIDFKSILKENIDKNIVTVLATNSTINKGINYIWDKKINIPCTAPSDSLYNEGIIKSEQLVIIKNYVSNLDMDEKEVLNIMGLTPLIK